MDNSLNLNTQAAVVFTGDVGDSVSSENTEKCGSFNGNTVNVSEVDPTTKDDEVMSGIKSEQETKKKKAEKARDKGRKGWNKNVSESQEMKQTKGSLDQSQYMRRLIRQAAKQIEMQGQQRMEYNVSERSEKLYPESKESYKLAYKKLNELPNASNPQSFLSQISSVFSDPAKQHNSLQIAKQSWSEELALLQGGQLADLQQPGHYRSVKGQLQELDHKIESLAEQGSQEELEGLKAEREVMLARVETLKEKLVHVEKASQQLMDTYGTRINDSYSLAPELRRNVNLSNSQQLMSPKSLSEIILDKILPLGKNMPKLLDSVMSEFFNEPTLAANSSQSNLDRFSDNLWLIEKTLVGELGNLQTINQLGDSKNIGKSILDAIQSMRELKSTCVLSQQTLKNVQAQYNIAQ